MVGSGLVSDEILERVTAALGDWIPEVLVTLRSSSAIDRGALPPDYMLFLIRAMGFLAPNFQEDEDVLQRLYDQLVSTVSAWAIHRNMKLVFRPLVHSLVNERGALLSKVKKLLPAMAALIDEWVAYFPAAASQNLEVCFL